MCWDEAAGTDTHKERRSCAGNEAKKAAPTSRRRHVGEVQEEWAKNADEKQVTTHTSSLRWHQERKYAHPAQQIARVCDVRLANVQRHGGPHSSSRGQAAASSERGHVMAESESFPDGHAGAAHSDTGLMRVVQYEVLSYYVEEGGRTDSAQCANAS